MANKATMSVPEMRELLGLKKTESYWLLKKNYFDVVIINKQLRIVISSFEAWYENQVHYRKVNGPEPGIKLKENTYTVFEISEQFGICEDSVLEMIHRYNLPHFTVGQHWRIDKDAFETWYSSQKHYQKKEKRMHSEQLLDSSMTIPQFGRLLGIGSRKAHVLVRKLKPILDIVVVGDHKRITKESIDRWYKTQKEYVYATERQALSHNLIEVTSLTQSSTPKKTVSITEAAAMVHMNSKTVYRAIHEKQLPATKIGQQLRIKLTDLENWVSTMESETEVD